MRREARATDRQARALVAKMVGFQPSGRQWVKFRKASRRAPGGTIYAIGRRVLVRPAVEA